MNIPEGWKLVPVEPTEEMKGAGGEAYSFNVENIYAAMLAAAPVPPQADAQPVALPVMKLEADAQPVFMVRSHGSECWEEMTGESLEMCQSSPEDYEVRKLYAHADAGELERLREEVQKLNISHEGSNALAASLQKHNETLHAQLAGRDALLKRIVKRGKIDYGDLSYAEQLLSASAEPADKALQRRPETNHDYFKCMKGE